MMSSTRTALLLGALTLLIVWLGNLFGGQQGMILAFLLAMAMNGLSYWYSDKIVLRMYRAREVTPQEAPELYSMVHGLAGKAGIPMPRLYVIPGDSPNAFATGRNPEHAVVAVTEGLLRLMNRDELEGVLAHELAHVKNRDILIGSIAATLAGAVMVLASMARWSAILGGGREDNRGVGGFGLILMSILAPIAALLIQMAVSRTREYQADASGARLTGQPEGLARALEKLGAYSKRLPMQNAKPATAHMFIVNPLTGRSLTSLFATHPPIEERVARLRGRGSAYAAHGTGSGTSRGSSGEDFWKRLSS